jgi:hypothetical protein
MEDVADSATESMRGVLTSIEKMLTENRNEWEHYLPAARSAITFLDEVDYFSLPDQLAEQRWIVQVLQDYAYHDSDDGNIQDIADWCQASWLRILRDHPDDVESLTGSSSASGNYTFSLDIVNFPIKANRPPSLLKLSILTLFL